MRLCRSNAMGSSKSRSLRAGANKFPQFLPESLQIQLADDGRAASTARKRPLQSAADHLVAAPGANSANPDTGCMDFRISIFEGRKFKGVAFSAKPSKVVFADFEVGKRYRQKVFLTNISCVDRF